MKIVLRSVVCVLGLLLLCRPATAQEAGSATDRAAITALLQQFYDGWNAHDVDKMVSIYADDIDHVNVFAGWHEGKAAVRGALAAFHAGPSQASAAAEYRHQAVTAVARIRSVVSWRVV